MSLPQPDVSVEFSVDEDVPGVSWDEAGITALVRSIVLCERPSAGPMTLAVHFVSDETIQALNAEHRNLDRPTDVLSFPLISAPLQHSAFEDSVHGSERFVIPPGEPTALGDVVLSYPRAVAQADEYGHSVEREVAYLVAHGVLHILGYDHEDSDDQQLMRQREEAALEPLGFTRTA
jgi:probable rRNA maturation factor